MPARLVLERNPELKYELKIGKRYCFSYLNPIAP